MHRIYLVLLSLLSIASASLLAIDYGGEWTKASVIKPGVPFDVLLNRDSKRKIQSSVAWKGEERLFGGDAFSVTSRFPLDSFNALKVVQGRPFRGPSEEQDPYVTFYTQISPNTLLPSPRGGVAFQRPPATSKAGVSTLKDSDRQWTNEELIAMQFSYIKDLADSVSGKNADKVRDVVLTVPPFYTQHERQALEDAVEIAGLRLHAIIHDGSAVAVNYAMTRTFTEAKEYHIIYDAGATSVSATIVSFSSTPAEGKSSKAQNVTEIIVAGVGFDRIAGGMEMTRRVRELLLDDFSARHQSADIRSEKRSMARLWKEAGRVKTILSANTEATSNVESVFEDIDFKTRLSRSKFEEACVDLKPRFVKPIVDALAAAGLTLNDISSVILTGGASRTPMIQTAVRNTVGESKIATNVNADEAAVLGAALYGASLSRQFKTKPLKVVDVGVWDVTVGYPAERDESRIINTLVFPAFSKFSSKKTLTLKRTTDFNITLAYRSPELWAMPKVLEVEVTGVSEALGNMTERLVENGSKDEPVVKISVQMDKDGFAAITDVIVWGEIKEDESFAAKLKGFFGGSKNETEESSAESSETTTASSTVASPEASNQSENATATTTTTTSPTATLSAKQRSTIKLTQKTTYHGILPMTSSEKRKSRDRLSALDTSEALRRRKDEARNNLEGYLYRLRDLLEGEESSPFIDCSKEEERRKIREAMDVTVSWLYETDDASTGEYWDKKSNLEMLEKPIQTRYTERAAFPDALSDLQQAHFATRMFLQSAADNATEETANDLPAKYTPEELESIKKRLKDSETWLNEGVTKQKVVKRCGDADPVILSAEMKARGTALQRDVMKMLKRKAPRKKTTTTSATESSTSDSSDNTSSSTTTAESASSASTSSTEAQPTHTRDEL